MPLFIRIQFMDHVHQYGTDLNGNSEALIQFTAWIDLFGALTHFADLMNEDLLCHVSPPNCRQLAL